MKKILVALTLCMVSVIGFRANPTTDNVEVLSDSIETNIETSQDSAIHNVILNDSAYKVVEDGIIVIVKAGKRFDVLGSIIE